MQHKISAILLAAGLSCRMDNEDKLLLPFNGKPLLQCAIDLLTELPVFEKILVTTPEKLNHISIHREIKLIFNKNPDMGQSESIKLGVLAATGGIYLFTVADQPRLTVDDITPLIAAAIENKDKIIFPTINNKPTTPTLFPAHFREELQALSGDIGGRTIRDRNLESCVTVEVENPKNFTDIDDMEDYLKLRMEN